MPFPIDTLDVTHAILIALHRTLFPDIDVSQMSDAWLELRTLAGAVTDNHAHLSSAKSDLLPDTSSEDMLDRWGAIRGVPRKGATPARKADAFRVFGVVTTPVPDAIDLVHVSGLRFRTSGASVIGPNGYTDVDIVAIDTGSATRLSAGERLTFATPVVDLEEEGELQKDLDEDGTDKEGDGAYSARILSRFSDPPLGGAAADYVQWALEEDDIAAAYCYPLRRGLGTVDVAALHAGSGTARILDAPAVADLQAKLDAKRPVSVKGFRVLQVVGEPVDVEYRVRPNGDQAYAWDWDDTTPPIAHAVTPWDSVTRKLTFTAARPESMAAGHRIVIANGATGVPRVIESLDGTDAVILEPAADGDVPVAGSIIYAAGPLTVAVRDAIKALIDGLGTANHDSARYGTWEGSLDPDAIKARALAVPGHLRGSVVTPVALVEASDPDYPDDGEIGLILPGRILVRGL